MEHFNLKDLIVQDYKFYRYKRYQKNSACEIKEDRKGNITVGIRIHEREKTFNDHENSDYIFRVERITQENQYLQKDGRWSENKIDLSEEEIRQLIADNNENTLSDSYICCKWILENGKNILGNSKFIIPKKKYQKSEENER